MARKFTGGTDHIGLGSSSVLGIGQPITVAGWFFQDGSIGGGLQNIFNKTLDNSHAYGLIQVANTIQFQLDGGNISSSPTTYSNNVWNHAAGTLSGTNGVIYLNGTSVGSNGSASFHNPTTGTAQISGDAFNGDRIMTGNICDVAVWSAALTALEVAALANGARPYQIRPGSLIGYWPLDGLQSPEPDLSGNANNGTLTGTSLAFGPPLMQFTPRWPQFLTPPVVQNPFAQSDWPNASAPGIVMPWMQPYNASLYGGPPPSIFILMPQIVT
jgi:hypothetical protein